METYIIKAPAKINLFLDVIGKRKDGYHEIVSVMQTVDLYDTIKIKTRNDRVITASCDNADIPKNEKNIAYKAAELFFSLISDKSAGCDIYIEKKIPHAAGLAGGSTDAAGVLLALNKMYGDAFSADFLVEKSAVIGADVPFCLLGGTKLTKGIGEQIFPLHAMPKCFIVISKSSEKVSTKEAYEKIDSLPVSDKPYYNMLKALEKSDIDSVCKEGYNIFEKVVLPIRPTVARIKEIMNESGASLSLMSGSGPSVFGIFKNEKNAKTAAEKLIKENLSAYICNPI